MRVAEGMMAGIAPDAAAMRVQLEGGLGLIHAESLTFALAAQVPRPEAQAEVKALCKAAQDWLRRGGLLATSLRVCGDD